MHANQVDAKRKFSDNKPPPVRHGRGKRERAQRASSLSVQDRKCLMFASTRPFATSSMGFPEEFFISLAAVSQWPESPSAKSPACVGERGPLILR